MTLLPALGGKIRELTMAGRQWLWHNPDLAPAIAVEGASFARSGNSGGYDDCAPTVAACRLPTWVKGAGDALLPDHGELWAQQPQFEITTDARGNTATCSWAGVSLPYRITRDVTVRPDGTVVFAYTAENLGANRIPFLWAAMPVFPLTSRTRLVLPDGARTRVWSQQGVEFGGVAAEHHWPKLRAGAVLVDLSRPYAALKEHYACKLYVQLPRTECVIALEDGDARLEMLLHGRETPQVGLAINRHAIAAPVTRRSSWPWSGPKAPCTVTLGPSLGAPDSLTEAIGAWDAAQWLEPGARAQWQMTWRGTTVMES